MSIFNTIASRLLNPVGRGGMYGSSNRYNQEPRQLPLVPKTFEGNEVTQQNGIEKKSYRGKKISFLKRVPDFALKTFNLFAYWSSNFSMQHMRNSIPRPLLTMSSCNRKPPSQHPPRANDLHQNRKPEKKELPNSSSSLPEKSSDRGPDPKTSINAQTIIGASSQSKIPFTEKIQWGKYNYIIRQNLPSTTSEEAWGKIVDEYKKLLKTIPDPENQTFRIRVNLEEKTAQLIREKGSSKDQVSEPILFKGEQVSHLLLLCKQILNPDSDASIFPTIRQTPRGIKTAELKTPAVNRIRPTLLGGIKNKGNTCFIASVIKGWLIYQVGMIRRNILNAKNLDSKKELQVLEKICMDCINGDAVELDPLLNLLKKEKSDWYSKNGELNPQDPLELIHFLKQKYALTSNFEISSSYTFDAQNVDLNSETIIESEKSEPYPGQITLHPKSKEGEITSGQSFDELVNDALNPKPSNLELTRLVAEKAGGAIKGERQLKVESIKTILSQAPEELIIHVGRYQENGKALKGTLENVPEAFSFPKEHLKDKKENAEYLLSSVICHLPNRFGPDHYIAYTRKGDKEGSEGFFKSDDSTVTESTLQEALKAAQKGGYILVYRKKTV